jgi:hypothetical protein
MYALLKNALLFSTTCIAMVLITSCDRLYSNYLADSTDINASGQLSNEYEIFRFANSVDAQLSQCSLEKSMIYTLGDYSFYIEKYLSKGRPVLYVEKQISEKFGTLVKYCYVKDLKPIFLSEKEFFSNREKPHSVTNTFFKDGTAFSSETKSASTLQEINLAMFQKAEVKKHNKTIGIEFFEDAIAKRGKFDLLFDRITQCPKAKYLILSRSEANSFRVPVKVEKEDEFIRAISTDPGSFRGARLDIRCKINHNNELVYVAGRIK